MKKYLSTLFVTLAFSTSALSFDMTGAGGIIPSEVKRSALPCLVGIVGSQLLVKDINVGLAICATVVTYNVVDSYSTNSKDSIRGELDAFQAHQEKLLGDYKKETMRDYNAHREAIRQVIVEKLSAVQNVSEDQVKAIMDTVEFESFLKEKTAEILNNSEEILGDRVQKMRTQIKDEVLEEVMKLTIGQ